VSDQQLLEIVKNALIKSPWVSHLNCGSCNGCDIEILAVLTPRYDVERFGIKLKGSPRHADVLLCTGSVTRSMAPRLKRIYNQMADPKFVVAVGSCATNWGVFHNCYNTLGGIDKVVPVAMYIPGCPPRPEAIVFGVYKLLLKLASLDLEKQEEKDSVSNLTQEPIRSEEVTT